MVSRARISFPYSTPSAALFPIRANRPTTLFCLQTIFGNLTMFLPLGFLLPLVSTRTNSLKTVLAMAFVASLGIEAAQFAGGWLGSPRWTDVDDILLNVIGALFGYTLLRISQAVARVLVRSSASPAP